MIYLDSIDDLDFGDHLRAGDRLVWGQACGEPSSLVEALLLASLPADLSAFVGIDVGGGPPKDPRLSLTSYIGSGGNSALHADGRLDILPIHFSTLPAFVGAPDTGSDVVLVRIPPPAGQHDVSLGTNHDYLLSAIERARVVIAEIDESAPYTHGDCTLSLSDIDIAVPSRRPGPLTTPSAPTAVQQLVAAHVAEVVEDGATLQIGVGSLAEAVLAQLTDRRHLGLHSGQISDGVVDLMTSGALTGERKTLDHGLAVAGMVIGSRRLLDFVDDNRRVSLRRAEYTHSSAVLAAQSKFTAINAALEVDLTGQVNSEVARGRYLGGVGGAVDFLRGGGRVARGRAGRHAGVDRGVRPVASWLPFPGR